MKKIFVFIFVVLFAVGVISIYESVRKFIGENKTLKEIITRLEADSRIAEVLVTDLKYNEDTRKTLTTIKFLEYDSKNRPLKPKYFTFSGNIIQFQSLVVRFDDLNIRMKDKLKGKSIYLFWKVFMLDGPNTQEFEITKLNSVPQGYKLDQENSEFESKIWAKFWDYALNSQQAKKMGIKNAQIEAPGTMFLPGTLYTIQIEHDGGMRIDSQPLPDIVKGENIISDNPAAE